MKKQRKKVKKKFKIPYSRFCINCGEVGSHFVPPTYGSPGFFTCEKKEVKRL